MSSNQNTTAYGVCCLFAVAIVGFIYLWSISQVAGIAVLLLCLFVAGFLGYKWFQNKQAESKAKTEAIRAETEQRRERALFEQQQAAYGLFRFVDKYGNEKWGAPEQVSQWEQEAQDQERINQGVLVREKETIIKEIVRVRCQYCGKLHDETDNKCPNCGASA